MDGDDPKSLDGVAEVGDANPESKTSELPTELIEATNDGPSKDLCNENGNGHYGKDDSSKKEMESVGNHVGEDYERVNNTDSMDFDSEEPPDQDKQTEDINTEIKEDIPSIPESELLNEEVSQPEMNTETSQDGLDTTDVKTNQGDSEMEISKIDESSQPDAETETTEQEMETSQLDTETSRRDTETSQQDVEMDADDSMKSVEPSQEKESKDPDDDIENPQFENAPEHQPETQEDHTQALDPFDELLKSDNQDNSQTPVATTSSVRVTTLDDDDEDHDDTAEPIEEPGVEPVEEPGADEEVCLLPDTEREISEADKEKALEARKLAEASAALESKSEPPDVVEGTEGGEEAEKAAEETQEAVHDESEVAAEGTAEDADKDKEEPEHEPDHPEEPLVPNIIQEISSNDGTCIQCTEEKPCTYKFLKEEVLNYLCNETCVKAFQEANPGQYTVSEKKYLVEEIAPTEMECSECEEKKICYFYYNYDGQDTNYCSITCLHSMMADERHKYDFKRRKITIQEVESKTQTCHRCEEEKSCSFEFQLYGEKKYVCTTACIKEMNAAEKKRYKVIKRKAPPKPKMPALTKPLLKLKVISNATDKYLDQGYKIQAKTPAAAQAAREDREMSFIRKCVQCNLTLSGDERNLSWETMDFCNEGCLGRYQNVIGSKCANCKNTVNHTSLGKYCVRFGYDIRQFCCSGCLEEFKKGLKICCYCQRDISSGYEGFLAPVGDKGQFKDFCTQACMEKFEQMSKHPTPQPVFAKCAVCSGEKPTSIEVEIDDDHSQRLCSDPCFAAFKFVNSICPDQCRWCKKYFERKSDKCFTIYEEQSPYCFCSKSCMNVYISNSRHIVPCNWCKVKKYNFDMIKRILSNGQSIMMCSLNCLNLYQVSVNAVSSRRIKCDQCKRTSQAQYHLTMSDATVRNFCTYQCVMSFQGQYSKHPLVPTGQQPVPEQNKAVPTGAPRRTYANSHKNNATSKQKQQQQSAMPVISNVQSLATAPPLPRAKSKRLESRANKQNQQNLAAMDIPEPEPLPPIEPLPPPKPPTPPPPPPPKIYNHVLVKTLPPTERSNKATMTKPMMVTKGVSCRPHPCTKECQTDPSLERRVLIPVPVPIYVPVPIAMYSLPFPIPVPIPIPIPTPIFIPTTRNSAKGIMKEISKIHDKMPTDPFEAELLMMAEMVAGDKKKSESDSETDDENDEGFSPDAIDGGNAFGEDMLQMALKMATEYNEPAVDLESAMTANTITPSSHPGMPGLDGTDAMHHHHQMMVLEQQRAVAELRATAAAAPRKRVPAPQPAVRPARSKRRRQEPPAPPPPEPAREPAEKPDANMCLKYTFGVNAWKQWVMTKNADIEKSSIRRKPFKSEILQLTADELNYSLCLFVKEVRKPNGSEYAPDTIYYLVLGIQQYLFENGRIDNIFTDPYYEKFTECLDEVARKFSVLYNDSQYIVTRVEEEHLWESKQLGAHSPHVLLSTLMFFNTKHFNLVTVEEHMQLSFSHIMKHWKRNPNQPGAAKMPGSRNVLLRFYPPQSALEANSRKKKVYEQQENEENPLRCPVKLYEFYISKCPESVRTRNDVFYLQPERSCVPDSPVWYSTQALGRDALAKMLHRVKMVKEINIALLTS